MRPGQLFNVVISEFDDGFWGDFGFIYSGEPFILIEPMSHTFPSGKRVDNEYWTILCRWGLIKKSTSYIESCCEFVPASM